MAVDGGCGEEGAPANPPTLPGGARGVLDAIGVVSMVVGTGVSVGSGEDSVVSGGSVVASVGASVGGSVGGSVEGSVPSVGGSVGVGVVVGIGVVVVGGVVVVVIVVVVVDVVVAVVVVVEDVVVVAAVVLLGPGLPFACGRVCSANCIIPTTIRLVERENS